MCSSCQLLGFLGFHFASQGHDHNYMTDLAAATMICRPLQLPILDQLPPGGAGWLGQVEAKQPKSLMPASTSL